MINEEAEMRDIICRKFKHKMNKSRLYKTVIIFRSLFSYLRHQESPGPAV